MKTKVKISDKITWLDVSPLGTTLAIKEHRNMDAAFYINSRRDIAGILCNNARSPERMNTVHIYCQACEPDTRLMPNAERFIYNEEKLKWEYIPKRNYVSEIKYMRDTIIRLMKTA